MIETSVGQSKKIPDVFVLGEIHSKLSFQSLLNYK